MNMQRHPSFPAPLLASIVLLTAAAPAPPPGELDRRFGDRGVVITDVSGADDRATGVAVQRDGKIVVVGAVGEAGGLFTDFGVVRYNPDGSLDGSFGRGGVVVTHLTGDYDSPQAVTIQPDGKILVAGIWGADPNGFALVRYNPDGSLDPTFDGDGEVLSQLANENSAALAVAVLPHGRIVAAGTIEHFAEFRPNNIALAWYRPDGTLLRYQVTGVHHSEARAEGIARTPDGKLVVGGAPGFTAARYIGDKLDPTFGGGGVATVRPGRYPTALAMALQPDAKIVLAGEATRGTSRFVLVRFTRDGSPDPGFGADGIVATRIGDSASATGVVVQADGRIVATGWTRESGILQFALARYQPDGSLDRAFGTGGIVETPIGSSAVALASALQANGKIVVVGNDQVDGGDFDFAAARYVTS